MDYKDAHQVKFTQVVIILHKRCLWQISRLGSDFFYLLLYLETCWLCSSLTHWLLLSSHCRYVVGHQLFACLKTVCVHFPAVVENILFFSTKFSWPYRSMFNLSMSHKKGKPFGVACRILCVPPFLQFEAFVWNRRR